MKYLILFCALILSGCAVVPQRYDPVLYDHYVQTAVAVKALSTTCNNSQIVSSNLPTVAAKVDTLMLYTKYRNEPLLSEATALVQNGLTQMVVAYSKKPVPSESYCHLKLQIIEASLEHILEAVGSKQQ